MQKYDLIMFVINMVYAEVHTITVTLVMFYTINLVCENVRNCLLRSLLDLLDFAASNIFIVHIFKMSATFKPFDCAHI